MNIQRNHVDIGNYRLVSLECLKTRLIEAGEGPAVVLIHGNQAWAYNWRYQLEYFTTSGHQVTASDLSGIGYPELTRSEVSIYGHSSYVGDLLNSLELERATFVVHSAGELPVLDFTIRQSEWVTSLVQASTCGVPHLEPLLWQLMRWALLSEVKRLFLTSGLVRMTMNSETC